MGRIVASLLALSFSAGFVPHAYAQPSRDTIVLNGVGKAHGLGMAMDGVVGQARAGWSADRILSLFYPDTTTSRASGTIRVGLAEGAEQSFVLPGGGTITGPAGEAVKSEPGDRITVVVREGRPVIAGTESRPVATPSASPGSAVEAGVRLEMAASNPAIPLETPPPVIEPSPSPTRPPVATPPPGPKAGAPDADAGGGSLRIAPAGDPALVLVEATGKRYRGEMEVRADGGILKVINHVGLETYVEGIAEARGAGWPLEAMKALAIAARTLGAATMSWYDKSRPEGYDICPTQNCQVYLGYDGEEEIMRRAVAETAGQIREYSGRPILAMYHGNGGGMTESYQRVAGTEVSSHPYLRAVRYPHANPSTWRRELTTAEIATALTAKGVSFPRPVEGIEILERGDSPRVMRLRVNGGGEHTDIRGTTFAEALDLWSTWFDIAEAGAPAVGTFGGRASASRLDRGGIPRDSGATWVFAFGAAVAALVTAGAMHGAAGRLPRAFRTGWSRPHTAPAPSPPGS